MKVFSRSLLPGAFGVAERTSSFLESFSDSDVESASDFFMEAFSAFSFNSEVSIAFLDFRGFGTRTTGSLFCRSF